MQTAPYLVGPRPFFALLVFAAQGCASTVVPEFAEPDGQAGDSRFGDVHISDAFSDAAPGDALVDAFSDRPSTECIDPPLIVARPNPTGEVVFLQAAPRADGTQRLMSVDGFFEPIKEFAEEMRWGCVRLERVLPHSNGVSAGPTMHVETAERMTDVDPMTTGNGLDYILFSVDR